MQELKKKDPIIAKMWLIHSACLPLQLIRKLYYRKVEVAFFPREMYHLLRSGKDGCQELLHHHFDPALLWVC